MKGKISEDGISRVFQRYKPETVIAVLQEIGTTSTCKIDWHSLAKTTSSGISCPREYQMLWRHLAYSHPLEQIANHVSGEPLSDESDVEFELEPSPAISNVENLEAEARARVLLTSAMAKSSGVPSIEAPLLINIPKEISANHPSSDNHSNSKNVVFPVLVPKSPMPSTMLAIRSDKNVEPVKKKRKFWSQIEDAELIAAVEVHGEGNWQVILKDYKHERTSTQLSQRWSLLKKRHEKINNGRSANPHNKFSESKLISTNAALSLALDPQSSRGKMKANNQASLVVPTNPSDVFRSLSQKSSIQSQHVTCKKGAIPPKRTFEPPTAGTINLIQQAALAAGGRMANPSTAASHFKAAQSKNVFHMGYVDSLSVSHGHASKTSPLAKLLPRQSNTIQNKLAATSIPISGSASTAVHNGSVPSIQENGCGNLLSQTTANNSPNKLSRQIAPSSISPSLSCKLPNSSKCAKPSAGKSKSSVNLLEKSKQKP